MIPDLNNAGCVALAVKRGRVVFLFAFLFITFFGVALLGLGLDADIAGLFGDRLVVGLDCGGFFGGRVFGFLVSRVFGLVGRFRFVGFLVGCFRFGGFGFFGFF